MDQKSDDVFRVAYVGMDVSTKRAGLFSHRLLFLPEEDERGGWLNVWMEEGSFGVLEGLF